MSVCLSSVTPYRADPLTAREACFICLPFFYNKWGLWTSAWTPSVHITASRWQSIPAMGSWAWLSVALLSLTNFFFFALALPFYIRHDGEEHRLPTRSLGSNSGFPLPGSVTLGQVRFPFFSVRLCKTEIMGDWCENLVKSPKHNQSKQEMFGIVLPVILP